MGAIFPFPTRGLHLRRRRGQRPARHSWMRDPFPLSATLPTTGGSPPYFLSFCHSENPKIWLPRALRQTYIRKVGDIVNLLIPFQVIMPAPCWVHDWDQDRV